MDNIPADNRTGKRKIGDFGENIACGFLEKHGYTIVERNYLRKWGEIDIVAKKGEKIHFIEVKSVSRENLRVDVSDETGFRPEDNMHPWKLKRLLRTIQTYMFHKKLDCEFQLDLITVKIDMANRQARVGLLENIT